MALRSLCVIAILAGSAMAQAGRGPGGFEKEVALGSQLAAEFRARTRAVESAAALEYVSAIGRRLVGQIGGPAFPYRFALVVDDPTMLHEVTAFPGGFVFVPVPLILAVKDEGELAGMLAHAIAHVASRDGMRQSGGATVPLIFVGGWMGYATHAGAAQAIPLGMMDGWRKFEAEADKMAVRAMAGAGYDPAALERYVERMQGSAERVAAIRAASGELPARVYERHEGLEKVQEELRFVVPIQAPPSLVR